MAEDTRKNILEVDVVQSIDKTDTVLVNDSGSLKQVSVETLVSSGIPDQYVTESELNGKGYATTTAMNSGLNEKIDKNQGSSNSGKYLSVGSDGNVKLVDAPSSGGGIIEETDPTVPAWAKNPTKPTYTADEVGALSDDTEIPIKTSDLTNDSGFITNEDIPEKLPNPQKIIFTGAVSAEYDGSLQQTINIPTGGGTGGGTTDYNDLSNKPRLGGVTLEGNKTLDDIGAQPKGNYLTDVPQASSTIIGGIKAESASTEDTVPVKIKSDGTLAVPTYPEVGSGTGGITVSYDAERQAIVFTSSSGGGNDVISQEQIQQAVNAYLEDNPVSGMTDEQVQQLNQVVADVAEKLNSNFGSDNAGKYLVVGDDGEIIVSDAPVISDDQVKTAVNAYLEENPVQGGITEEQKQQLEQNTQDITDLRSDMEQLYMDTGVEYHEYTEAEVEIKRAAYNSFYDGTETPNGTSTSTVLFKTPQKIRVENNHTQDITVTASRFANSDDYESATYTPGSKNDNARRDGSFLNETIPMGESVTFDTYEYGSSGAEYIQLRFQPGTWNNAWNNIKVYAIYDSWRPTYTLPEVNGIYEEDIPVRYTFQGTNYALNSQELIAVAPYYPDFTYNIRGGNYETTAMKTLDVIYLMDNSIFDGYHDNIFNRYFTSGHKNIPCIFPEKTTTTQYDTSVNAGANSDYAWAYFKTPPETELIGPKWVAIIGMYKINHSASEDLGQEYYNEQIQTLNDSGPQLRYVTKFNDKNAPRRLLSTYVKRVDKQSDGTYYTSILKQSDNPLAGKKWTLFGDSLTDAYGGHDLTGNYFASKIAREFGMILDNRAKGGGNINSGANGNYTSINGCACLDQLISDVEDGITDPPDYITVAYGTNGYTAQNGTVDDTSENKETTCGAVKYFIEKCTEKFPNAFLGFVLPPLGSWKAEDGQQFPNVNKDVDTAREAIKSVLDLPEYGGIPYIDMSKKSGITLDMLPDKIHISTDQTNLKYYRALRGFLITAGV